MLFRTTLPNVDRINSGCILPLRESLPAVFKVTRLQPGFFLRKNHNCTKFLPFSLPFSFPLFSFSPSFSLPSHCPLLLSSPPFPFHFLSLSPLSFPSLLFSFSFPLSFLSQKTKQEVWGALLAPPAGSGAWHHIAANCNCTNVQLELHILCRNCTLGQTLIAAYSISMKSTQGDLRMLPRGHARTHTQTDGQPENLRPLAHLWTKAENVEIRFRRLEVTYSAK